MSLSQSSLNNGAEPYLTEFIEFLKPDKPQIAKSDEEPVPEGFCSRITRLYNLDGSLNQASTGFFSLNRIEVEGSED
jgi:hypothetical protein